MDLDSYWQENKRFVLSVAGGAVAFLIGWWAIDSYLGSDLRKLSGRRSRLQSDLALPMFQQADLDAAKADNQSLRAAVDALRATTDFKPREAFELRDAAAASSRYLTVASEVREGLLQRAGRAGLVLPTDLGLPTLAPSKEQEIARTLEALDAIERTVGLAIEAGVERIDAMKIRLDSRLLSGKPIDDLEKTRVELRVLGPSEPIVRMLLALQDARGASPIQMERAEFTSSRTQRDEVKLELEISVVHPHALGALPDEEEG